MFRTYNASVTLDRLLWEEEEEGDEGTVDHKKAIYDRANKEARPSYRPPSQLCEVNHSPFEMNGLPQSPR